MLVDGTKSVAKRQKMLALEQNMVAFGLIIAAPGQKMLADVQKNCSILMNKTY